MSLGAAPEEQALRVLIAADSHARPQSLTDGAHPQALTPSELPRYRPSQLTGVHEYLAVGQDLAISALAGRIPCPADTEGLTMSPWGGMDEEDNLSLRLVDLPPHDRRVDLLFGGVGDGRSCLATFRSVRPNPWSCLLPCPALANPGA
jgi:hypothetical protein